MSDIFTRNTPVYYELRRISLQLNSEGDIVATADIRIRNADGAIIDDDHPTTTLSPGEADAFKTWVRGELAAYEVATGLTRYTG